MRRRLVLIAEGKSTRLGFKKMMDLLDRVQYHINNLEEPRRAEKQAEFDFFKALLLKIDPKTLPEEKRL